MKTRLFLILILTLFELVGFQNCSLVNSSHNDFSLVGKTCLATAQAAFSATYYPYLRAQCSQCHDAGGAGISWFANKDQEWAFNAFMGTTRDKVNLQMVNAGHPGPNNGPQQQPWVDAQAAQWSEIDRSVDTCVNANAITTVAKNTSVQDVAITDNLDSNKRPWRTLEFDLYNDVLNPDQKGKIDLVVRIRYRESGPGTLNAQNQRVYLSDIGYEFSKPTARIRTGAAAGTQFAVDKLSVLRNGVKISSVTSFEAINDVVVGSTTFIDLLASGVSPGVLPSKDIASDMFQLRFAEIRDANGRAIGSPDNPNNPGGPVVPARVTFSQLASSADQYGYFARNCAGCHGGATPAANLNLTSYSAASLSAATIKSRVNDAMRPMPPGGLLDQFSRDVISKWVDIGAPQN